LTAAFPASRFPTEARHQWRKGGPHSLTVAGAAAGWARQARRHRIPVSPAAS